ncbi:MAG: hypothetical protein VYA82_11060, partial [Pseudomonadota bacterium]|nr:hypothetical protein [Pseudomonadota bacterium]
MPSVSATPGVVVGSYTDLANAQSAAENARRALGAISSEIEIHIVSQGANARVVVVPAVAAQTRSLLSQVRNLGFTDAWYLAQTGVSTKAPVGVVASQPVQAVTPVPAVEEQAEKPVPVDTPLQPRRPRPGAGAQAVVGQEAGVDLHRLSIQTFAEADVDIVVDGKIDESLWQTLPYYDNMLVSIPALVTPAEYATQIR